MSRARTSLVFCVLLGCGAEPSIRPADDGTWPSRRYLPQMAYDADRGRVVLFGGSDERYGDRGEAYAFAPTWEWDGARWTRSAESGPRPRTHHAMAYDRTRRAIVLHGGVTDYGDGCDRDYSGPGDRWCDDTWVWEGSAWAKLGIEPDLRLNPSMIYDSVRDRLLLIHGVADAACFDGTCQEIWTLSPEGWTPLLAGERGE